MQTLYMVNTKETYEDTKYSDGWLNQPAVKSAADKKTSSTNKLVIQLDD